MDPLKESFIHLALKHQVLKFGEFTLKSGRQSPYFFNAALFYQGNTLREVGYFYAKTLVQNEFDFQHLFGPAYKGFSLAIATAIALSQLGVDSTVTFNRKEVKDHGEGGQLIGSPLYGKTVIVDDVITAGTTFRESKAFISQHSGDLSGMIIALDRCEKGSNNQSALAEIQAEGIRVLSIIDFFDLIGYLNKNGSKQEVNRLLAYQEQYGYHD